MFSRGKMLPVFALAGVLVLLLGSEAGAQTAGNLDCNKCVETNDLAKKAVNKSRLKNNAVTGAKIRDGTVGLGDLSSAVQQLIADLQAQVTDLQAQVTDLQGQLAAAESDIAALQQGAPTFAFLDFVTDLAALVTVDEVETDLDGDGTIDPLTERLPRVLFEGVNVQVVNSDVSQSTGSLNGLGNLIVGYNEPRDFVDEVCSDGRFADNAAGTGCEDNGHVWAVDHKSGSHNLVVGPGNAYSQTGSVVFGRFNAVNRRAAAVTGGTQNTASGQSSSVSGGQNNTASGASSSVGGGDNNEASELISSVSGGSSNEASGAGSSVSGGFGNMASASSSSVSGGQGNTASGPLSSVSGGFGNMASGNNSSVSGGDNVTISGACAWGGEDGIFLGNGICTP